MLSTPMYIIAYERSLLQIGSGLLLPAQWEGGARANIDLAAARNSPKEKRGGGRKKSGIGKRGRAKIPSPHPPSFLPARAIGFQNLQSGF